MNDCTKNGTHVSTAAQERARHPPERLASTFTLSTEDTNWAMHDTLGRSTCVREVREEAWRRVQD
jgi:hypothetical protein